MSIWLGKDYPRGVSGYADDKIRSNRTTITSRGRKRFDQETKNAIENYHEKRNKAIADYNRLVNEGKVKQPTSLQKHYKIAQGHPDLKATQAARRILKKKGYDWETGKKLKG